MPDEATSPEEMNDEIRQEYDLSKMEGAVRGKCADRCYREGSNIVLLAPDVAEAFPTSH